MHVVQGSLLLAHVRRAHKYAEIIECVFPLPALSSVATSHQTRTLRSLGTNSEPQAAASQQDGAADSAHRVTLGI